MNCVFRFNSGSIWISSELKGLNDDCEHFEVFPPGHLYSSKQGGLRRWYNPPWFSEAIPSVPYDPLALRQAFESVRSFKILIAEIKSQNFSILISCVESVIYAGCDQKVDD